MNKKKQEALPQILLRQGFSCLREGENMSQRGGYDYFLFFTLFTDSTTMPVRAKRAIALGRTMR